MSFLAVDPVHQRKGHGGVLIRGMLDRIDGQGLPCYLEAIGERNIGFYEKFGFHVLEDIEIEEQKMWAMLRNTRIKNQHK